MCKVIPIQTQFHLGPTGFQPGKLESYYQSGVQQSDHDNWKVQ
jgi:hypothetical protein